MARKPTEPAGFGSRVVGVIVGLLMAGASAGLASVDNDSDATATAAPTATTTPSLPTGGAPDLGALEAELAQLVVDVGNDGSDYSRDAFNHWIDADGNGCDTRKEVLIAESTVAATLGTKCVVTAGSWFSLYDALTITNPKTLDIDHMVPLKEAWRSGASDWDDEMREQYANDMDEPVALIAVTATTNRSKGDKDPARWRPPDDTSWCTYASAWLKVKVKWGLTADQAEVDALRDMLATC